MSMQSPPIVPPYPVESWLTLTAEERRVLRTSVGESDMPLPIDLQAKNTHTVAIGLFFDGADNNQARDEPKQAHSNVVRLFKAHKDNKKTLFAFYVPGMATKFPQIGEYTDSAPSKAWVTGGQARVLWGLLQAYNAVYRALSDANAILLNGAAILNLLREYEDRVASGSGAIVKLARKHWFQTLTEPLSQAREALVQTRPEAVPDKIVVSVFGFSMGAMQARAFCHWFDELLEDGLWAGVPTEIRFLGLFDSVGLPHSLLAQQAPGHGAWAVDACKPLPACVQEAVHHVAAHEQRMNFSLTRLVGDKVTEVCYPGVHSDVGGGYGLKNQGRSPTVADLLSQIPLVHMYKAALLSGVALERHEKLTTDKQADFAISSELAQAWSAYMHNPALPHPFGTGSYAQLHRQHMVQYYRWRDHRLGRQTEVKSYQAIKLAQEKYDLITYDMLLQGDLQLLAMRQDPDALRRQIEQGSNIAFELQANLRPLIDLQNAKPLTDWEEMALTIFAEIESDTAPAFELFESHVHDSLAGFYIPDSVSVEDKVHMVGQAYSHTLSRFSGLSRKIRMALDTTPELRDAVLQEAKRLASAEQALTCLTPADISALDAVFPVLTAEGLSTGLTEATPGNPKRRETGGYLRPRWVVNA